MEIIDTGALRRLDAERTEDVTAVQLFQGIYGVGMLKCYCFLRVEFALLIRPDRAIDCVCLVPRWLPHARRHQAKEGRNTTISGTRNRVEVLRWCAVISYVMDCF